MISAILRLLGFKKQDHPPVPSKLPSHQREQATVQITHEVQKSIPQLMPDQTSGKKSREGSLGDARAKQLLKDATQLKNSKNYDDACAALREAYAVNPDGITLSKRLRLPAYLALAERNDEAWRDLNELNLKWTEPRAQAEISKNMSSVLQVEKRYREALVHECWAYAMEMHDCKALVEGCIASADKEASAASDDKYAWMDAGRKPTGETPSGNPIYDCSFPSFDKGLKERLSCEAIIKRVRSLVLKIADEQSATAFVERMSALLERSGKVDFVRIRDLVKSLSGPS